MIVTQVLAGIARRDGGPSYSVPSLNKGLNDLGVIGRLRTVNTGSEHIDRTDYDHNVEIIRHDPMSGFGFLRSSPDLYSALKQDARDGALIHVHGLWLLPNVYPAWIKRGYSDIKIIHSPRGMLALDALRFSKWKKMPFWYLWQRSSLQEADCLHATSEAEYQEIRNNGLTNPVAVIPNGIDLPNSDLPKAEHYIDGISKTILSLGRLHPKKALDLLIRAWSELEDRHPDWRVQIIGTPENNYDNELRKLSGALGLKRLTILGPVYGEEKNSIIRNADLFVLPTLNENFGIVVAEALANEVPVISTRGAPWSGLERERCGWWIDHGAPTLASTLEMAMNLDPKELAAMGRRGRAWMERDFSWSRVASEMRDVYAWLKNGDPMPSCVRLD